MIPCDSLGYMSRVWGQGPGVLRSHEYGQTIENITFVTSLVGSNDYTAPRCEILDYNYHPQTKFGARYYFQKYLSVHPGVV